MIAKHIIRFFFFVFWVTVIYILMLSPYVEKYFSKDKKYVCIYTWADRIDESVLQEFEEKTGIKVHVNYYESNEELLTKLEHMPYVDCDLILPSGYIISSMAKAGLLKKIDKNQCKFIDRLYERFVQENQDQRHLYGIPLYWDVLGIGYNNQKIDADRVSLDLVFNPQELNGRKIGMIDDARQSIVLTSLYLNYDLNSLSTDHLLNMKSLLNRQKQWVGVYSDSQQGYYLSSKTLPLVVSEREYICKQMLNHDYISFMIPKEGSLLTVEYAVISASTKKDDLVYQLLNYLFEYEVLKHNCENFCLLPTVKDVYKSLDQKYIGVEGLWPGSELFNQLKIFNNVLTHKQINDFWVSLKSS